MQPIQWSAIRLKPARVWMICLGLSLGASGCGYLDEDIALSDEAFEASFAGASGGKSVSLGLGSRHISRRGCGIGGTHASHSYHAHSNGASHVVGEPTIIDMDPTYISAQGQKHQSAVVIGDDHDEHERAADAPVYAAGELETWGDYLEAELERAEARNK